jgi:hypothetical protein
VDWRCTKCVYIRDILDILNTMLTWRCTKCVCIRDILDILNTMLTWRCTKCVTSRYGKCHNIRKNEIGELYTILSS